MNSKFRSGPKPRFAHQPFHPLLVGLLLALALAPLGQAGASLAPAATIHICPSGCDYPTIQAGLANAPPGSTLLVGPGAYNEVDKIFISKNVLLTAADPNNPPILRPDRDTGSNAGSDRAWIIVDPGVSFSLNHFILDGDGFHILEAIQSHGSGVIEFNTFRNLRFDRLDSVSDLQKSGTAIFLDQAATTVRNNLFENIGRIGALACGPNAELIFSANTYHGKGASDRLDVAAWVGGGASASIDHNSISNNSGGYLGLESAAIRVDSSTFVCQQSGASSAEISSNTLLDSAYGILVGASITDPSHISAFNNRIAGNTTGVKGANANIIQDAQSNWWGCNNGPNEPGCDTTAGPVIFTGQLELTASAAASTLWIGQQTSVQASITGLKGAIPDGTLIFFRTNIGSIDSPAATSVGLAETTYRATAEGTDAILALLDNEAAPIEISLAPGKIFLPLNFKLFGFNP